MTRPFPKRELLLIAVFAFVGLVVLPCLNGFVPATSPFHVTTFTLSVYGKYLCYAVLALGVNLLWGYTGLLSLGQCLFFALGGYALGMYLMLKIGKLGQYKSDLPDFMVFLEFDKRFPETGGLPPHWIPFKSFGFAAAMVVLVPAVVAFIFGWLAFRSRIKGVYFSILSQALTYAATLMFFRNDFTFGGNNGLTDFKFLLGCEDVVACAQYGLDWLDQHAGISRALCAVSVSGDPHLSGVAGARRTLRGLRPFHVTTPGRRHGRGCPRSRRAGP